MSSALPFEDSISEAVQQFGLGPYDSESDDEDGNGENSNKRFPKKSLPDGGGSTAPDVDTMLSYPSTPTTFAFVSFEEPFLGRWRGTVQEAGRMLHNEQLMERTADLPGDADRPPVGRKQVQDTINDPVMTESQSKLPNDGGNPSARSDYYDHMRQGLERAPDPKSSDLWADEDSGAYASEQESLPVPMKNEVEQDDYLQATGNAWSGRTVEDTSNETGFPATDYAENVDFERSDLDGGGKVMASGRVATNIDLVASLTDALIKKFGKKDLTRRHVLALLHEIGKSQYFASDIIRCLKLSHGVFVKDVMDEFPISKMASNSPSRLSAVRDNLVDLEILHMDDPSTAGELRRCAAALSTVIAAVERISSDSTKDYDDYAPARGHAEDSSARDAYKDYVEDHEGEPVSFEEFLEGKH